MAVWPPQQPSAMTLSFCREQAAGPGHGALGQAHTLPSEAGGARPPNTLDWGCPHTSVSVLPATSKGHAPVVPVVHASAHPAGLALYPKSQPGGCARLGHPFTTQSTESRETGRPGQTRVLVACT